jgi:hypothetical protein
MSSPKPASEPMQMQQFTIFRALGLTFRAWFRNFIPFTLLAAVLFSPVVLWAAMLPSGASLSAHDLQTLSVQFEKLTSWGIYAVVGISALLSPLLTYRVVQDLNGYRVSLGTSMKFGLRGIAPAIILALVTTLLQLVPRAGGIVSTILLCYWFVAAPAAVAEKLGPGAAFARSAELTRGRRWGIFGLNLLIQLAIFALVAVWIVPLLAGQVDPAVFGSTLRRTAVILVVAVSVFELFVGVAQAVCYTLLRTDKDGISNEELARVFE